MFGFNQIIRPGAPGGDSLLSGSGADFVRVPLGWANRQSSPLHLQLDQHGRDPARARAARTAAPMGDLEIILLRRFRSISPAPATSKAMAPSRPSSTAPTRSFVVGGRPALSGLRSGSRSGTSPNVPKFWQPGAERLRLPRALLDANAERGGEASRRQGQIVFGAPSPVSAGRREAGPDEDPDNRPSSPRVLKEQHCDLDAGRGPSPTASTRSATRSRPSSSASTRPATAPWKKARPVVDRSR